MTHSATGKADSSLLRRASASLGMTIVLVVATVECGRIKKEGTHARALLFL